MTTSETDTTATTTDTTTTTNIASDNSEIVGTESNIFKQQDFLARKFTRNGNLYESDMSPAERVNKGVLRAVDSPQDIIGVEQKKIRERTEQAAATDPNAIANQLVAYSLYSRVSAINVILRGDISRILADFANRRSNMLGFEQAVANQFAERRPMSDHDKLLAELDEFIILAEKMKKFRASLPV